MSLKHRGFEIWIVLQLYLETKRPTFDMILENLFHIICEHLGHISKRSVLSGHRSHILNAGLFDRQRSSGHFFPVFLCHSLSLFLWPLTSINLCRGHFSREWLGTGKIKWPSRDWWVGLHTASLCGDRRVLCAVAHLIITPHGCGPGRRSWSRCLASNHYSN